MSNELRPLGLLTTIDVDALAAYCVQFARWKKAEKMVKQKGEVTITAIGNEIQNPYLAIANRALKEMGRLGAEFGFSPAARVRLHTPPPDDDSDLEKSLFGDNVKTLPKKKP